VERLDLMVLNPPRKGIQAAAMEPILAANAPRIIYVSCDPKSLARDLNRIVDSGYGVRHLQPFDMFPQTAEVETVVLVVKG
jgi:23S rRNA (uracil1939-C5)-methyltransferase